MAGSDDNNTPSVILHRLPQFRLSIHAWLQPQFLPLELSHSDPLFPIHASSARVLLSVGPSPVTSETLDKYPSLECVVGSSAGVDHIDLVECRRRGIKVTSAGDAFSEDVADYAVGLLIDVLRRVSAADRYVRAGLWPGKGEFSLGSKLGGKQVGIVGLGSIGSLVAKRLEAFGCIIAYNSRSKKPDVAFPYFSNVHDLATNSEVLIICCALTNETHHLINKGVLKALGKKGVIVNVGRGALIDEKELVQFLVQGEIGGAGLDVYEHEPNVPKELFELDNVVLSPHKAVLTPESLAALRELGGKQVGSIGSMVAKRGSLSAESSPITQGRRSHRFLFLTIQGFLMLLRTNSDILIVCCALTNEIHNLIKQSPGKEEKEGCHR